MLHVSLQLGSVGYTPKAGLSANKFYVCDKFHEKEATHGSGWMIAFISRSEAVAQLSHQIVMQFAGLDEGAPGSTPDNPGKGCYAYEQDLNGNYFRFRFDKSSFD